MDHVPPQHQHDADAGNGRRALSAKRLFLAGLALLAALGFAGLGIWQVERRAWKLDLIARVEHRIHAGPTAPPATFDAQRDEYARVRLAGRFVPGRSTLVQALTERGAGFWVLTPLRTDRGIILVNRGFVASRDTPVGTPAGQATVTGLLRASEPGGGFLRTNDPAAGRWYSRDVAVIARARKLGPVAPYFVDADATPNPGGAPIGGLTVVRFSNNHLVYALTWFALAGLSLAAAALVLRRKLG